MELLWEEREMEFRGEKFRVQFPFYRCMDTGNQFTTTESDGVWYDQMTIQYNLKHGIPLADELASLRHLVTAQRECIDEKTYAKLISKINEAIPQAK